MTPPAVALTFWTSNTRTIFSIALDAASGIGAAPRAGGQRQALISFVFATAAMEAFLNESVYLAEFSQKKKAEPLAHAFAEVMGGAEESRAQLPSKFHLAHLVLTGKTYDKGTAPFQDFSLLVEVRNALVHFKSKEYFSTVEGTPTVLNPVAVLERLASRHVLALPVPGEKGVVISVGDTGIVELVRLEELKKISSKSPVTGAMTSWTRLVGTKEAAKWACNAAARIAVDLMDEVPNGTWKNHMESHFSKVFVVPWK